MKSARHRRRAGIAIVALALFAPTRAKFAAPPAADPTSLIESLFRAARYDTALIVIEDAIARAETAGDSLRMGRMHTQRGRVYLMQGRMREAERAIDAGIMIARAARDTAGWMPALTFKGYALAGLDRPGEAMACYEQRLDLARRVGSSLDEAWALTNTGYVRLLRGEPARARADYERAIALFRKGGRSDLEPTALIGLGRTWSALGETQEAVRCYQLAWITARDAGDRENEMWATNNLGAIEAVTGDTGRATQYAWRAYLLAKEMGYPRGVVVPAINIATWISELGEYQRAAAVLAEAREICLRTGNHEYLAKLDFQRAQLVLSPREPHAAIAEFRRLLESGLLAPLDVDYAHLGLARALAAADSVPAAVALLESWFARDAYRHAEVEMQAHLVLSRLLAGEGDAADSRVHAARARAAAERQGWRRTAVTARLRESACLRALGRGDEARAALAAALDSLEAVRGGVRRAEWREAFGQGMAGDVFDAARVLLESPASKPRAERERVFFDTIQRFKARTLAERISEPRRGTIVAAAATAPAPTVERLQNAWLREGELYLDIVAGRDTSYLFAITPRTFRLVPLPGSGAPLSAKVETFRQALADPDPASQALYTPDQILTFQRTLGRELLGGVSDLVARAERLIVSPDGFYQMIPWATLVPPRADGGDGAQMLMETHDVALAPSAAALGLLREAERGGVSDPARVAVVVAPDGRGLTGTVEEALGLRHDFAPVEIVRGLEDGGADLPAVAERCDVLHIAAHALALDDSPWNSGFDLAARETARPEPESATAPPDSAGVVFLSTYDSLLVATTFRADSWLRAWRIAGLSLPLEMAVLAGCETAGGRVTTGEGVLGLTAAFVSAGVPVVVASLWPIADHETARLMDSFYSRLADGATVAAALRGAQLEVRAGAQSAHPFYWAGFTVVGDGSAVLNLRRSAIAWTGPLMAVLIAAGVALALAIQRARARRSTS